MNNLQEVSLLSEFQVPPTYTRQVMITDARFDVSSNYTDIHIPISEILGGNISMSVSGSTKICVFLRLEFRLGFPFSLPEWGITSHQPQFPTPLEERNILKKWQAHNDTLGIYPWL